jgi:hypothetical protein
MSLASTAATLPVDEDQLPDVVAPVVSTGAVVSAGSEVLPSELGSTGVLSVIAGRVEPGVLLLPESSPHAGTIASTIARAGAARRYRWFIRMPRAVPATAAGRT